MPSEPRAAPAPAADGGWLRADWDAPRAGGLMTTRSGGASAGVFSTLNLRHGLGDDPAAVDHNLDRLRRASGAEPVLLHQVHGARVVRIGAADVGILHEADASVTTEPGIGCAVQVADCLPVLMVAGDGRAVGAAHAGWRGLAAGVVEATLAALCEAAGCAPQAVQVWLGACIGPRRFEVGADVLAAFGADPADPAPPRFAARAGGAKWLADLPGLARDRLARAGVRRITGGAWCTVEDASRFFSFRRDRVTGRMIGMAWIRR
jgi:YfiH family protein